MVSFVAVPGAPEGGNDLRGEIVRPQIAVSASECEEIVFNFRDGSFVVTF